MPTNWLKWGVGIFTTLLIGLALVVVVRAQSSGDVIYACVTRAGRMRLVNAGATCREGEVLVSWNVKGDKGDKGDQGPQGIQGVKGDPGTVSLPDGRCWSNGLRYVDCGNGTVTDQVTGLIWLKQIDCLADATYGNANQNVQVLKAGDCGLTDKSVAGQWRLPTKAEWQTTIEHAVALGCSPSLTNTFGTGCYSAGPKWLIGVEPLRNCCAWSSTAGAEGGPGLAWIAALNNGFVTNADEIDPLLVWPVRGGPF